MSSEEDEEAGVAISTTLINNVPPPRETIHCRYGYDGRAPMHS
jgi:hypothetical protein